MAPYEPLETCLETDYPVKTERHRFLRAVVRLDAVVERGLRSAQHHHSSGVWRDRWLHLVPRHALAGATLRARPLIPATFSHGIAIAPDGKTLWVTSLLDNSVSVYTLPEIKYVGTTPVGRGPDWMVFTPDNRRCYVSNAGSDSVSVLDAATHEPR